MKPMMTACRMNLALTSAAMVLGLACIASIGQAADESWPMLERDAPKLELVLQLVVTCTGPERVGGSEDSKDGKRTEIWPIVGGRFQGKGIRGSVVAGGGDFPVVRPDGVEVVDALYRLRTDDGVTIIIHNKGLGYPSSNPDDWHYRLFPEFIAPKGKYAWLNSSLFLATLSEVPDGMRLARGPKENDRLIQIYRVL
ncbi:MAG TPA: DUF3237 domain-containing protein [Steroidobacteraceae bacterium]|nr:DUF3237 domain-containing protein [Steroidobacteraceae bacterium]